MTHSDKIYIRDLHIITIIGIHPKERTTPQPLILNITLNTSIKNAAESDHIQDTVDYHAVTQSILTLTQNSRFFLIEKLAQTIAQQTLTQFPQITSITVTIDKPEAIPETRSVAVEITRHQSSFHASP